APPERGRRPSFEALREHIGARLGRAPRYRQRLKPVPFGLSAPYWVDDDRFDLSRHVVPAASDAFDEAFEACMSEQLPKDRPLWQLSVAERLRDGRIGVFGKAHHSMVDGIAAVELASLLLDPEPEAPPPGRDDWRPWPEPTGAELLVRASAGRSWERLRFAAGALGTLSSPKRLAGFAGRAGSAARALADAARPARASEALNAPSSPRRHLGTVTRPLAELKLIKAAFGTTINDVLLAACAGAARRHLAARDEDPRPLKAMVPVDMRAAGDGGRPGNRLSFIFCDLPCDEADTVRRLRAVHAQTASRKRAEQPGGADALLDLLSQAAYPIHRAAARLVASPRAFNLVVSNIPGPPEPMYMRGCLLEEAYPVVPLAEGHAVSIGMATVGGRAFFGLYADRETLPDVDRLAAALEAELDAMLDHAVARRSPPVGVRVRDRRRHERVEVALPAGAGAR
ncbi:MAG TPA: wax ester/triacylglycerol synthase family O-acyltransferase, partial [Solirubrobacterales bacterium]|nr:wax ester/triacylglycerol synthase family O-acyltransferase [Solirubrobacterales bacterium]